MVLFPNKTHKSTKIQRLITCGVCWVIEVLTAMHLDVRTRLSTTQTIFLSSTIIEDDIAEYVLAQIVV